MTRELSVVAIIAAYNEEDLIAQVVSDLIRQGVSVYLVDHHSTDRTVAEVAPYLGRGVLGIESFPPEGAGGGGESGSYCWTRLVGRKAELAHALDADWFIHHDADEFRESPWPGMNLREAIQRVDALGYNAIDFEVLNFWPTHDGFRKGDDVRRAFPAYEPGQPWDKVQIRCWKKQPAPVELAASGGHEARFPGRRVFPVRFILRHYPVRGQAHGERKVFRERLPRFDPAEREQGWHVQYAGLSEGHSFLRDPATLTVYDPVAVRLALALRHRGVEELEAALSESGRDRADLTRALERSRHQVDALQREGELRAEAIEALRAELGAVRARLDDVLGSRSWRWTGPVRRLVRLVRGS
jgi:hypothetical protein